MKLIQSPNIFIPESIEDYAKTLFLGGGIKRIVDISKKLKLKYSCVYAAIHRKEESYE